MLETLFVVSILTLNCNYAAAKTPNSTLTQTDTYTSCSTSLDSQLPILSFAQSTTKFTFEFTCDALFSALRPTTLRWYYYSRYPPSGSCVPGPNKSCHKTADSKIEFTSSEGGAAGSKTKNTLQAESSCLSKAKNQFYLNFAHTGETFIKRFGHVVEGPYKGKKVQQIYTVASTDQTACISKQGLELRSGTVDLTIIDGPICTGVVLSKFSPGIHLEPPSS